MKEENECYRFDKDGQTADLKNKNIILGFVSEISFSLKGPTMTESTREIEIGAIKVKTQLGFASTRGDESDNNLECGQRRQILTRLVELSPERHTALSTPCLALGNTFQTFDL